MMVLPEVSYFAGIGERNEIDIEGVVTGVVKQARSRGVLA